MLEFQGPILGRTFFLQYINGLPDDAISNIAFFFFFPTGIGKKKKCNIGICADDTTFESKYEL